ncbi:MAG: MFS transporter [Acidimicrobiales bacterium]
MTRRPPLALIYVVTVTGVMLNSLIAPAIPDILDTFGQDASKAGILVASGSLPGIVVAPMVGFAADRFGRKRILVPCLLVFGSFGVVAATAPTFNVLLAARFAMGFGSAGLINLAVVMLGDSFSGANRTRAIGRNAAVLTTGLAVLPLISGLVTDLSSWRWALAIYTLALGTAGLVIIFMDNFKPQQTGNVKTQLVEAVRILRQPILATTLVSGALTFALIFGVFLTALPVHLEREFGLSAGWRGLIIAVPAVTSTMVSANLARLRGRWGLRTMMVTGSSLFVVSFVTMGLTGVLGVAILGAAVYGLGEGATIPTLQDVAVSAAPDQHRGGILAGWVSAARLGQTIGPLAAAPLIAATDTGTTMVIGGLVAILLVLLKAFGPIDDRALQAAIESGRSVSSSP